MKVTDVPGITKIDFWYQQFIDCIGSTERSAAFWRLYSPVIYDEGNDATRIYVRIALEKPVAFRTSVDGFDQEYLSQMGVMDPDLAGRLERSSLKFRWATAGVQGLVLEIKEKGMRRNLSTFLRYVIREIKKA